MTWREHLTPDEASKLAMHEHIRQLSWDAAEHHLSVAKERTARIERIRNTAVKRMGRAK